MATPTPAAGSGSGSDCSLCRRAEPQVLRRQPAAFVAKDGRPAWSPRSKTPTRKPAGRAVVITAVLDRFDLSDR
ncbi:hypothetical protein SKAU_G00364510 [Synaphobranchus kaupii]|uniref:Uncharacterized protein n=1 Tax=Synaphobranchus kaupii TaxID=118154 RepID=A0A9Q1IED9_SYNKA|nr:hypothetical protein SKAU_G00364510 [Synaphobranchus kaupii]